MSRKLISFYKTLDDLPDDCRINFNFDGLTASCDDGELLMKIENNRISFEGKDSFWDVESQGLHITGHVGIDGLQVIFKERLVSIKSTIGLAAIISSISSNKKEAKSLGTIEAGTPTLECPLDLVFEKGQYRENASVKFILYLKTLGEDDVDKGLTTGTILGTLGEYELMFGQKPMLFPVYEVKKPGQPLWWVNCRWTNIEEDTFTSDNVSIIINASHKCYRMVRNEDEKKIDRAMLAEIMCSAMQIIIEKIRNTPDEWEKVNSDYSFIPGTVAATVQYMFQTFDWQLESPESLSRSLHEHVYRTLEV